MQESLPLKIVGVGHYLPERVVSSRKIEEMFGLPEGLIVSKTGVHERHWVKKGETSTFMGAQAAREAVDDAGLGLRDLDLIMNASGTSPQAIPDGGHLLQRELGLGTSGIPCMTIHTTCLSFLVGLDVATGFTAAGRYQTILIVSSDVSSCGINFKEPESAGLFGDAAAAVVVTRTPKGEPSAVTAARFEGYSRGADYTRVPGGGTNKHPNHPDTKPEDNLFQMDGAKTYRLARKYVGGFLERLRPGLSKGLGTVDYVVPHQPSLLGLRSLRYHGMPDEKVGMTLDRFGNCVAASMPLTLYMAVREGLIQRGHEILLMGVGAGLSFGGMILIY
jgi:3-oxoacyl-[acyl-carrier-protein] synthase-3